MSRRSLKLAVFMDFVDGIAALSTCLRDKVGAVIVDYDLTRVEAIGYNGPAKGLDNDSCRNVKGGCGCSHAEANAICKLRTWDSNLLLIMNRSPCESCCGLIANCGQIRHVIYKTPYRVTDHLPNYPFDCTQYAPVSTWREDDTEGRRASSL